MSLEAGLDFLCTDEQLELRAIVRDFLASKSAEESVRELMATPTGYDPAVWRQMSDQLGLAGLAVPEEYGGAGFGYVELGIVFEEMGRALLCAPYLASVALATEALLRSTDEAARKDLLPGLATGTTIGTVALLEQPGRWDKASVQTRARQDGTGWVLDGGKRHVLDGHIADLIMVGARTPACRPVRGGRRRARPSAGTRAHPRPDPQAGAPGVHRNAGPADRGRG